MGRQMGLALHAYYQDRDARGSTSYMAPTVASGGVSSSGAAAGALRAGGLAASKSQADVGLVAGSRQLGKEASSSAMLAVGQSARSPGGSGRLSEPSGPARPQLARPSGLSVTGSGRTK